MKTFLALYMGSPGAGPPPDMSQDEMAKGMKAWGDWMAKNAASIVEAGGPLGKTKKATTSGVSPCCGSNSSAFHSVLLSRRTVSRAPGTADNTSRNAEVYSQYRG